MSVDCFATIGSAINDQWGRHTRRDIAFYRRIRELLQVRRLLTIDREKIRIGRANDGGYVMLDDFPGGAAYSFGISNDVSWDNDMVDRGYDVYMYDHTIAKLPMDKKGFHFFRQGLAGNDQAYPKLATVSRYLKENGHIDRRNMILKVDVEGAEWDWLLSVQEDTLDRFDQIVIELHWITNHQVQGKILEGIQKLNKTHGLLHLHGNNNARVYWLDGIPIPDVLECLWVNRKTYPVDDTYRSRLPNALDAPNAVNCDEISLTGWESRTSLLPHPWAQTYGFAVSGSSWLKAIPVGDRDLWEVSYCYLYFLYRLLDEQHPKSILEFNVGQATKMTAQYASACGAQHVVLEKDRLRTEHFISCWRIPWENTLFYGAPLWRVQNNGEEGVFYRENDKVYEHRPFDLILMKSPVLDGVRVHMDLISHLKDILAEEFAILVDHGEDSFGSIVLHDMETELQSKGVDYLRRDIYSSSRYVCILASKGWKYVEEF